MINNGRVFFFFQLWSINYPGNAQQCGGILQIHHHHPSSHCDLPNPRAKHLSGGNSRFTFPSFAFRLNRRVKLQKSPLPGSVEFTAKGTKILQHCFVPSLQPAAQMDQLKGNKRQPPMGQMVLRRGLGADWWRRAEHRGRCTKAGLWPGKAVKGGSSPTTRDTTKASNIIPEFYTEIGGSSLSKANISDSDKSKEKDKNRMNHH